LQRLSIGDEVTIDGAYGSFTIANPGDTINKYLFIGTGTGIAPFHSFALSYPELNYAVLHGIKTADEQYDKKDYSQGKYIACVSRDSSTSLRSARNDNVYFGRVTGYLRENPVDPKTICYLCGNSDMINEAYDILRSQGVNGTNIITEVFF
jgi:ferredoxin-NADP reductase